MIARLIFIRSIDYMNKKRKKMIMLASSVGESMYPIIHNRDRLRIRIDSNVNYQIGDIVAYLRDGRLIAHRIIKIIKIGKRKIYYFKGDNNSGIDSYVKKKSILGKVEEIISSDSTIDLTNKRNTIIKYVMLLYSMFNLRYPMLFRIKKIYKVPIIRSIYSLMVEN